MIYINHIYLRTMRSEDLYEFSSRFIGWTEEFPEMKAKILPVLTSTFIPAYNQLDIGIRIIKRSGHTLDLVVFDTRRDNAWLAIGYGIRMYLLHPQKEFVDAAYRLESVCIEYKGLNRKKYGAETGAIRNVLQDFDGEYKKDIEKLDLSFWVEELKNSNNEFARIYDVRDTQTADKAVVDMKATHLIISDSYEKMANFLNISEDMAAADAQQVQKYETAFKKLNAIIAHFGGSRSGAQTGGSDNSTSENGSTDGSGSADQYPNAREWSADIDYQTCASGDIFYIIRNGVKEYYKLLDFGEVATFEPGMDDGGIWEKLS